MEEEEEEEAAARRALCMMRNATLKTLAQPCRRSCVVLVEVVVVEVVMIVVISVLRHLEDDRTAL